MSKVTLAHLINMINIGILHSKDFIECPKTRMSTEFLTFLLAKKVIVSYYNARNSQKYEVILKKKTLLSIYRKITLYTTPSKLKSVTSYKLESLIHKNRGCILILHTSQGYKTGIEALASSLTGFIIARIDIL
jgi:ribosomal protein S8